MNFLFNDINNETIQQILQKLKTIDEVQTSKNLSDEELAKIIDHTLLKPETTKLDIEKLCQEALEFGFFSVCVNPVWVEYAFDLLKSSNVKVCTVIGFPLGANKTETKLFEAEKAISEGADEIDMVLNIGKLKSKDYQYVYDDIKTITDYAKKFLVKTKVIIETSLLNDEEKIIACILAKKAEADFVKTSTGFSIGGATEYDVRLMRIFAEGLEVKASGGIKTKGDALKLFNAGATRIGTSSGIKIIKNELSNTGY